MEKAKSIMTSKWTILLLQLFASFILLVFAFKLNAIPMMYLIAGIVTLVIIWLIFFAIMQSGEKKSRHGKKSKRLVITKVASLVMSIILLIGSFYIVRGDSFISKISDAKGQKYLITVRVLKDSKIESIEDLRGTKLGVNYHEDSTNLVNALAKIEAELADENAFEIEETPDFLSLADSLYNGSVDAVICGNEYNGIIQQKYELFPDETKVIYKYEVEKKVETTTNPTNVTENPFTLYLTGIDTEGSVDTVSRSDVNLVVTVHPKTRQILMISIPRDTQINLHRNGQMDKLTHTGIYGTTETINTIEDLLDVDINYFGRTNFSGMEKIVDALGGITVESPYPTFTTLHGRYRIEPGVHHFDGHEALCFVRERYSLPNGDFDRGKNQQRVLKAMLDRVISPTIITNFSNILSAVEDCFETDMSQEEIKSLINMQLNDMSSWTVHNVQLSGSGYISTELYSMYGQESYVMTPNRSKLKQIKELIDRIEDGEILTAEDTEGLYDE